MATLLTPDQLTNPEQNLIKPTRISTKSRAPGFIKAIILDVLSVASAGLFGYLYYRYLSVGISIWFLLAGLTLFGVLSVLQMFLSKDTGRRFLIINLETAALLGFFYRDDWQILAGAGVAVLIFLTWGYLGGRVRLKGSIEIPFFGVTGTTLGKFTTAMIIFMILAYVPQLGSNGSFVSAQGFRVFFDWAAGYVNSFYPNLSLNDSFGTFAQGIATMELADNPTFQGLSAQQKSATVSSTAAAFTDNLSQSASTTIVASESTSDAFYTVINGMLNSWKDKASSSFVLAWGIILFFVLRGIGIIFVWLAQFVSLIFYEILLSAGFMRITETPQTKESIEYS
jgi:hypothetical protein